MKTFSRTLAIGVAMLATATLAPAAFAQRHHHGPPPPSSGLRLATDIVNLVGAVLAPAPVYVAPAPRVVTRRVVTRPVVTSTVVTQPTVVVTQPTAPAVVVQPAPAVTTTTVTIPEYSYVSYRGAYVPYYDGWYFYGNDWVWGGIGVRPALAPRWRPRATTRTIIVTP